MTGKLTEQQRKFVHEYLKDFNGQQAAIRAGYSKNTAAEQASRLLTKDRVCDLLAELRGKVEARVIITKEEVLNNVKEIMDRGLQKTETIDTVDGLGPKGPIATKKKTHQLAAAAKAADLAMKHLGMYQEHEGQPGPVTIVLQLPEGITRSEGNKAEAQGAGREAVPADKKPEDPAQ